MGDQCKDGKIDKNEDGKKSLVRQEGCHREDQAEYQKSDKAICIMCKIECDISKYRDIECK